MTDLTRLRFAWAPTLFLAACGPGGVGTGQSAGSAETSGGSSGPVLTSTSMSTTTGEENCEALVRHDGDLEVTAETPIAELRCLTEVTGQLTVTGLVSTDLGALSELTVVGGGLNIRKNTALESLDGLEQLEIVDGFVSIGDNPNLLLVDGLSGLREAGGVHIMDNDVLPNLDGLGANGLVVRAPKRNGMSSSGLSVRSNDTLTNVDALGFARWALGAPSTIRIEDNPRLETLAGLAGAFGGDLSSTQVHVENNDSLRDLDFLTGVTSLQSLTLFSNESLRQLEAASSLEEVRERVSVTSELPEDMTWLRSLSVVGGELRIGPNCSLPGSLVRNDSLWTLDGLQNLNEVGELTIVCNPVLEDVSALLPLLNTQESVYLELRGNPMVPEADAQELCELSGHELSVCTT